MQLPITSNFGCIVYRFRDIDAKSYKTACFPTLIVWCSGGINPSEFLD